MLGREQLKIPIATHDTALRAVASRIIGHTLSDLEWRQAKLLSGKGGLALSDVLIIADAAHISSHAASARILARILAGGCCLAAVPPKVSDPSASSGKDECHLHGLGKR